MKPPKWQRDEIIMALDLYYSLDSKEMDNKNPKVIQLSQLLNRLPIHKDRKDYKFRNPNGVALKLSNFKAIDPNFAGKGMDRYSKLDKKVFFEFDGQQILLKTIAEKIKRTVANDGLTQNLNRMTDEEDDEISPVKEGRVIYKLHKLRERNSKINKRKKESYFRQNGKLDCEVCGFDFVKTYGSLGEGFIEAHHRVPLSEIKGESQTELEDLALVCSNCHRMLHKGIDSLTVDGLRVKIKG